MGRCTQVEKRAERRRDRERCALLSHARYEIMFCYDLRRVTNQAKGRTFAEPSFGIFPVYERGCLSATKLCVRTMRQNYKRQTQDPECNRYEGMSTTLVNDCGTISWQRL